MILSFLIIVASIVEIILKKGDRTLWNFNIIQGLILGLSMLVPYLLNKLCKIKISYKLELMYVLFMIASFLFGEVCNFYGRTKWWDSFIHFSSGVYMGAIWFGIIDMTIFRKGLKVPTWHICLYVVSLVVCIGAVWEIVEYGIDGFFDLNMQQFMLDGATIADGDALSGHYALTDTIKDLFLDLSGGIVIAIIGGLNIRKKGSFLEGSITKNKKEYVVNETKKRYNEEDD